MFLNRLEMQEERKAWELYLVAYGNMDKKTFKTFDEFYNKKKNAKQSKKTKEEIIAEAERVKAIHQKKGGKNGTI